MAGKVVVIGVEGGGNLRSVEFQGQQVAGGGGVWRFEHFGICQSKRGLDENAACGSDRHPIFAPPTGVRFL